MNEQLKVAHPLALAFGLLLGIIAAVKAARAGEAADAAGEWTSF